MYNNTDISESPRDATVFLQQTKVFTCMIRGAVSYQYWRVNGTAYNHLPPEIRADLDSDQVTVGESEEYTLTIPGRAEYNGTRIQCVIGGEGGERESENATLKIQGINITCTIPQFYSLAQATCTHWYRYL